MIRGRVAGWLAAATGACLSACLLDREGPPAKPEIRYFPRGVEGLEEAGPPRTLDLADGDSLELTAAPVRKRIRGREVRMLAFGGSVPGPVLRVPQGAVIRVKLRNRLGLPAGLHAHGVRVDRGSADAPAAGGMVADGEEAEYVLRFPDPGLFWYRSEARQDYSQALGLYGCILVTPSDDEYWNPVDREAVLILGDVLMDSAGIAPYRMDKADHAVMGRFGNVFLVNGDTSWSLELRRKEYVRFHVVNATSARVFNLLLTRTFLKLVGSDNGRFERSMLTPTELIGPGERSIFEAAFPDPGVVELVHETPDKAHVLGRIRVLEDSTESLLGHAWGAEDTNHAFVRELEALRSRFDAPPDEELVLAGEMRAIPGKRSVTAHYPGEVEGIAWYDHMEGLNSLATPEEMRWILRDAATGRENLDIDWRFRRGERPLIRIRNDPWSAHAMPHPIHFQGQRFLVVRAGGEPNPDLAWKDTFLVGKGSTVDILLEADNPGEWYAECRIPEHLEAGMRMRFVVE